VLPEEPKAPHGGLPFSRWYPLLAGVVAGLLLRFAFSGAPGGNWSAMTGAFIYFAPMLVGAVTVYAAETTARRSWAYYFWAPFLANILCVFGTLLIMIEGMICAIVILPMFAFVGAMGGVVMGVVCRLTNWPRQTIYSLAAVPLLLGVFGDHLPADTVLSQMSRSVVVQAKPAQIWAHLNHATGIAPKEFSGTLAAKIGVPMPVSGMTVETTGERVRKSVWAKSVRFDEPITDWQPERYMRWTYRFDADSFPPHALDDHVLIGGHYFDLRDTSFRLTPVQGGTRLEIETHYRVTTQFNFYADAVARLMLGDMQEALLGFYKQRSESSEKTALTGSVSN
jgi:Polyketide cyclase / dehydrase and lipid transport